MYVYKGNCPGIQGSLNYTRSHWMTEIHSLSGNILEDMKVEVSSPNKTEDQKTVDDKFGQVETELEAMFAGSDMKSDNPNPVEKTDRNLPKIERRRKRKYTAKKWEDYAISIGNFQG